MLQSQAYVPEMYSGPPQIIIETCHGQKSFLDDGSWMSKETVVLGLFKGWHILEQKLSHHWVSDALPSPILNLSSSQLLLQPLLVSPISNLKAFSLKHGEKTGCELPHARGLGLRTQTCWIFFLQRCWERWNMPKYFWWRQCWAEP